VRGSRDAPRAGLARGEPTTASTRTSSGIRRAPRGDASPRGRRAPERIARGTPRTTEKRKKAAGLLLRPCVKRPARTYFPDFGQYHRPRGLNGRVRNGIGCDPPGMCTGQKERNGDFISGISENDEFTGPSGTSVFTLIRGGLSVCLSRPPHGGAGEKVVKPIGQLVPVR
jgi:hypothetical protein